MDGQMEVTDALLNCTPRIRMEIWCSHDDGTIRFAGLSGQTILLNRKGARIWRLIDKRLPLREVIAQAALPEDSGPASSSAEVLAFIQRLYEGKWISLGAETTWSNSFFTDGGEGRP